MLALLDSLLSLPFLSFLLLPTSYAMTSFTTSLNLLFFYMTWTTVVLSHKPLFIEFWATLAARTVFYILPCLVFLLFDISLPGLSASVKAYSTRAMPLGGAIRRGSRASAATKRQRLLSIVGISCFNTFIGVMAQTCIELVYTTFYPTFHKQPSSWLSLLTRPKAHPSLLLPITTTLPLPWAVMRDLARLYISRAILSYYIHRILLHNRDVSPLLTRLHATWQHQLRLTIPFSAGYDHPLAYLAHTWLPMFAPSAFFRVHFLTYLLFLALVSVEEALAWSGYMVLPLGVLLSGAARRTEKHLLSGGEGNFAPYGLLDWIHGTSLRGRDVLDDVREEMHRRDLRGRVKRVARQAGERLWTSSSSSSPASASPSGDEEYEDPSNSKETAKRLYARRRRGIAQEEQGQERDADASTAERTKRGLRKRVGRALKNAAAS